MHNTFWKSGRATGVLHPCRAGGVYIDRRLHGLGKNVDIQGTAAFAALVPERQNMLDGQALEYMPDVARCTFVVQETRHFGVSKHISMIFGCELHVERNCGNYRTQASMHRNDEISGVLHGNPEAVAGP